MKEAKSQYRVFQRRPLSCERGIDFPTLVDKSMRLTGICGLVAGIVAAAMDFRPVSDYLLAAGLLLLLISWFGDWWEKR